MQAVFREYEEWLGDEEILEYVARGFNRAETKLEACLPYEEELVNYLPKCVNKSLTTLSHSLGHSPLCRPQQQHLSLTNIAPTLLLK
jgi:hypothetical protein